MSRIALCFNGLAGGKNDKGYQVDWQVAVPYFEKNIINYGDNEVDVFFHTWSAEAEEDLVKLYNPKRYTVQKQIDFDLIEQGYEKKVHSHVPRHLHSIMSRWHSNREVLWLKEEYEAQNDFKYDYVMTTRFDVAWLTPLDFSQFDRDSIWCGRHEKDTVFDTFNEKGMPVEGVLEYWLFGGSEVMDCTMYMCDRVPEYIYEGDCRMSNHDVIPYHIEKENMLDKFKFHFWEIEDFQLVRRLEGDFSQ